MKSKIAVALLLFTSQCFAFAPPSSGLQASVTCTIKSVEPTNDIFNGTINFSEKDVELTNCNGKASDLKLIGVNNSACLAGDHLAAFVKGQRVGDQLTLDLHTRTSVDPEGGTVSGVFVRRASSKNGASLNSPRGCNDTHIAVVRN